MIQLEKTPFFRKTAPWHATTAACLVKAAAMLCVALFGIVGIRVARQAEACGDYIGMPVLVLGMSMVVMIMNLLRIIRRYSGK